MRIKSFILMLILVGGINFSQTSYNNDLEKFEQIIVEYNRLKNQDKNTEISSEKMNNTLKILYNVYEKYPKELKRMINKKHLEILNECKENKDLYYKKKAKSLGVLHRKVLDDIKNNISPLDYHLLTTNIIMKGTINSQEGVKTPVSNSTPEFTFSVIHCKVQVDDVLKGEGNINPGDVIEVVYREAWLNNPNTKWEEGKSYLFNLRYNMHENDSFSIAVITGIGETDGFFPIINDKIHDTQNFFEQGVINTWAEFKSSLDDHIKIIFNRGE